MDSTITDINLMHAMLITYCLIKAILSQKTLSFSHTVMLPVLHRTRTKTNFSTNQLPDKELMSMLDAKLTIQEKMLPLQTT